MSVLDIDELPRNPPEPSVSTDSTAAARSAPSPRIIFNDIASKPGTSDGLIFAIRTDARYATALLKNHLIIHAMTSGDSAEQIHKTVSKDIERGVHDAYGEWGRTILGAMAEHLDYERYGLKESSRQKIDAHFYNARNLAAEAEEQAKTLIAPADQDLPVVYITLDELIEKQNENWAEISFSRLFEINGTQNGTYMARPGKKPLAEQIAEVRDMVDALKAKHGRDIPIVLMEDNVRQSKMLNWVIDLLDQNDVFVNGKLAGISTCFCCAPPEERQAIVHNGTTVPLAMVVDYGDAKVDVTTTRDLLFDGFVVQAAEKTSRLPGIFMDIEKVFKIRADKISAFHDAVMMANLAFCETIKKKFGVEPLLSWFQGADAIAHVTKSPLDMPMSQVICNLKSPPRPPVLPQPVI